MKSQSTEGRKPPRSRRARAMVVATGIAAGAAGIGLLCVGAAGAASPSHHARTLPHPSLSLDRTSLDRTSLDRSVDPTSLDRTSLDRSVDPTSPQGASPTSGDAAQAATGLDG